MAIECRNLNYRVGENCLLADINCDFKNAEVTAILGKNGAGKSTLLKLLSKQVDLTDGEILFDGRSLAESSYAQLARQRAVLPQQQSLSFSMTVTEMVALGADVQVLPEANFSVLIVDELLKLCEIDHLQGRDVLTLSGGELQRVQLARVLAQIWPIQSLQAGSEQPFAQRWLLLDEWNTGLDLHHQQLFVDLFQKWAGQGLGIVMVLHDLNLAAQVAHEIKVLQDGHLALQGNPSDVLNEENIFKTLSLKTTISKRHDANYSLLLK